MFFVPETYEATKERIKLTPEGKGFKMEPVADGGKSARVIVAPAGEDVERRITIE